MLDGGERCPIFCITDIPTSSLDFLLHLSEEYLMENQDPNFEVHTVDRMVIMDTKDISDITPNASIPVASSPTAFVGMTLEEVRYWYDANITQPRPDGYMPHCFLVLDEKSVEDESCIFVCTQDAPLHSLRCDFDVSLQNAIFCNNGKSIEEGVMGSFMRSGMLMTKANLKLAENGGLYIERGEVKLDQAWRDFSNW